MLTNADARQLAYKPAFQTGIGLLEAGSAFPFRLDTGQDVVVTCQHLFGPAGGLNADVPPAIMPRFVFGTSLRDPITLKTVGTAGGPVVMAEVRANDPLRDLAAFPLPPDHTQRPLRAASAPPKVDAPVWLVARVRGGAPSGQLLHPARYVGDAVDGTSLVTFDQPKLVLAGASGAPVVNEEGAVVGILVRYTERPGLLAGFLLPARAMLRLLASAHLPPAAT
jgi:hypothetical protein